MLARYSVKFRLHMCEEVLAVVLVWSTYFFLLTVMQAVLFAEVAR